MRLEQIVSHRAGNSFYSVLLILKSKVWPFALDTTQQSIHFTTSTTASPMSLARSNLEKNSCAGIKESQCVL